MNSIDIIILAILFVSTAISFLRGFVKEVLSLAIWVAALWVSIHFSVHVAILLEAQIQNESARFIAAFIGLFVATLIVGSLANVLFSQLIKKTGFSGTDRMIGLIFGFVRGGLIVSVVVMIVSMTSIPQEVWWKESILLAHFQEFANWMESYFPVDLTSRFALKKDDI